MLGMLALAYVDDAMSASVNHSALAPLVGETCDLGITRSQVPHSIARENPSRFMFWSYIVDIEVALAMLEVT